MTHVPVKPMKGDDVTSIIDTGDVTSFLPCIVQPKLDGIRALILPGGLVQSASGRLLPNIAVQEYFKERVRHNPLLVGCDMELLLFDKQTNRIAPFNVISSHYMSINGDPPYGMDWHFAVFDKWNMPTDTFHQRHLAVTQALKSEPLYFQAVTTAPCNTQEELVYWTTCFCKTYEGAMLRKEDSRYRHGRSSLHSRELLKYKPRKDSEAIITGVVEKRTRNSIKRDPFGYAKTSHKKEDAKLAGTMGALLCKDTKTGVIFKIGTGFTATQRDDLWRMHLQNALVGKQIVYTYQAIGVLNAPRHPSFKGFRDDSDLTDY